MILVLFALLTAICVVVCVSDINTHNEDKGD